MMKKLLFALYLTTLPAALLADDAVLKMSPTAAYTSPDTIANNIKDECDLPVYQAEAVRRELKKVGIAFADAGLGEVPSTGKYLQLGIPAAYSTGNAGIGHRKQVTTSAQLFENGKEIGKTTSTRNSMGGFMGGFKGSCSVLQRCADATASDLAKWLKTELARAPASADAAVEPVKADAPASQ